MGASHSTPPACCGSTKGPGTSQISGAFFAADALDERGLRAFAAASRPGALEYAELV
jgi:hypothetical protein